MKTFPYSSFSRGYALGYPQPRRLDSGVTPMRLGVGILRVRDELGQPIDAYDCLIEAVPSADKTTFVDFYDEHRAEEFYWVDPYSYLTYEAVFDPANPPQVTPQPQVVGHWDLRFTILPTLPTEPVDMLVAHWKMNDDTADTAVVDATGNGHNGVASHNTEDMTVAGKINAGLEFVAASSRYVAVSDHANLRLTDGGTICCWVKWDGDFTATGGFSPRIWARASYTGLVIVESNGRLTGNAGGVNFRTDSGQGVVSGTWVHVAVVFDPVAGTRRIYVNGVDKTADGVSGPMPASTAYDFFLAARTADSGYFDGVLDDVRIYKRPLTRAEIQAIYNGGSGTESEIVP